MKFKIKFIIISLIFTSMFISCEKEKVDVMNTFNFTEFGRLIQWKY